MGNKWIRNKLNVYLLHIHCHRFPFNQFDERINFLIVGHHKYIYIYKQKIKNVEPAPMRDVICLSVSQSASRHTHTFTLIAHTHTRTHAHRPNELWQYEQHGHLMWEIQSKVNFHRWIFKSNYLIKWKETKAIHSPIDLNYHINELASHHPWNAPFSCLLTSVRCFFPSKP